MIQWKRIVAGAAFVVVGFSCSWTSTSALARESPKDDDTQFERFIQVLVKVRNHYVDSVRVQSLVDSAIVALVRDSPPPPKPISEEELAELISPRGKRGDDAEQVMRFIRAVPKVRDRHAGALTDEVLIGYALRGMLRSLDPYSGYFGGAGDTQSVREASRPPRTALAGVLEGGVAYLRLPSISEQSCEELDAAIAPSGVSPPSGLVLDLRANQGGYFQKTIEVIDAFAPRGAKIAITRGRDPSQNRDFLASADGAHVGTALVVLVDEETAAGAEIVAGAIQDLRLGIVMGRTTSGKGLIQTMIPLTKDAHGPLLRLTTGRVFSPSGRAYQRSADERGGVTPDLELTAPPAPRPVEEMDARISRELALPEGSREVALRIAAEDKEVAAAAALLVEAGTLPRLLEMVLERKRADPGGSTPRGPGR